MCDFTWMSDLMCWLVERKETRDTRCTWCNPHPSCPLVVHYSGSKPVAQQALNVPFALSVHCCGHSRPFSGPVSSSLPWNCISSDSLAFSQSTLVSWPLFLFQSFSLSFFLSLFLSLSLAFSESEASLSTLLHQERDNNLLSASVGLNSPHRN